MGENSAIQWTTHTLNPWVGCTKVSPGCTNCYAEAYDKRVGGAPKAMRAKENVPEFRWGPNARRVRTSLALWRKAIKWNEAAKAEGERHRVFCASLADVFDLHESIEPAWRLELFSLIRQTPALDWLLLSKRPENFRAAVESALTEGALHDPLTYVKSDDRFEATRLWLTQWLGGKPPENVLAGTTVEDQERTSRLRDLLAIPAAAHFLSMEPLLEAVNILRPLRDIDEAARVDWVIVGGESGGKARGFNVAWARSLVSQARQLGAAPFVKQLGSFVIDRNDAGFGGESESDRWPQGVETYDEDLEGSAYQGAPVRVRLRDHHGGDPAEWPVDLRVREFPEVRHG